MKDQYLQAYKETGHESKCTESTKKRRKGSLICALMALPLGAIAEIINLPIYVVKESCTLKRKSAGIYSEIPAFVKEEMSKDEILQKYGSESEEYRHYCEVQHVIKLKKVERDEYFRKIEERRGIDARNRLWVMLTQNGLSRSLKPIDMVLAKTGS
ncbi:MAG: hypothetical protein IPI97_15055 [Nitrosomonas sp.]|nr:hypothetical protein [Nitrosomonas sp.]